MNLSYSNINLFPSVIHQFDVNGFNEIQDELIDFVYNMREKDPVGHRFQIVVGGNHLAFQ